MDSEFSILDCFRYFHCQIFTELFRNSSFLKYVSHVSVSSVCLHADSLCQLFLLGEGGMLRYRDTACSSFQMYEGDQSKRDVSSLYMIQLRCVEALSKVS